jgi:hypothetical protein
MKEQTLSKITKIVKEQQQNLIEHTGVQTSVDEEEMKRHVEEVIREVHGQKEH